MKHFHISDPKSRLAIEIFNDTSLLLEQQAKRRELIKELEGGTIDYIKASQIGGRISQLSKAIKTLEKELEQKQIEHDKL